MVRACAISNSALAKRRSSARCAPQPIATAQIVRDGAHVRAAGTVSAQSDRVALDREHRQLVDVYRRRLQFDCDIFARQFVSAPAIHLSSPKPAAAFAGTRRGSVRATSRARAASMRTSRSSRLAVRQRDRKCSWPNRSAPCLRRSCRCACRTAPGAWRAQPPAAGRRWRSDRACPGGPILLRLRDAAHLADDVVRGPALGLVDYDNSVQWVPLFAPARGADVAEREVAVAVEGIEKRQDQRRRNQQHRGGKKQQPANAPCEEL